MEPVFVAKRLPLRHLSTQGSASRLAPTRVVSACDPMPSSVGRMTIEPDPSIHNVPADDSGTLTFPEIQAEGNVILELISAEPI